MVKRTIFPAETLSADTQAFFDVLNNEPDFSAVVVSCAYLDACLASILKKYFLDSDISNELLDARAGAIGNFSTRAALCYSLGLVSKRIYQDLVVYAEMRNEVAHHHLSLNFSSSGIARACEKLKFAEFLERWDRDKGELMFGQGQLDDPRTRFVMNTALLSQRLLLIALGVKRVEKSA